MTEGGAQVRQLAVRVLEAYTHGLASVAAIQTNLDAHYNDVHLMEMAKRLTASELACLQASAQLREEGLRRCRSDHNDEADTLLAAARATLTEGNLSEEATVVGHSFQQPAEAYLHYRRGNFLRARRALLGALGRCRVMEGQYGYTVDARRVHLARNIVRLERARGDKTNALHLALSLVRYIDGAATSWPFDSVAIDKPAQLSHEERRVLMDQIWREISHLLLGRDLDVDDLWRDARLIEFGLPDGSDFWNLRLWLDAMNAFRHDDTVTFLENARGFFKAGPILPSAWREVRDALLMISEDL